ncbi:MAG: phospholipid carrier-dependent glycosyltransferase [Smithella sp.]
MEKRHLVEIVCLVVAFVIIIRCRIKDSQSLKFDIDEVHKIAETYYYNLFFVKHDFKNSDWNEDFYARTNPPAAKYIMGAYLGWHGQVVQSLSLQQKFEQYWKDPQYLFQQIPTSMLINARTLVVIFSGLTLIAVYLIGRFSGSIPVAILSALLLLCNPTFKDYSSLALTDIILMFFMTIMVLVTLSAMKMFWTRPTKTTRLIRTLKITAMIIIPVIVIVAATGTKLNGALTAVLFITAMLCGCVIRNVLYKNGQCVISIGRLILIISSVMSLAVIIFIAFNPYLYESPFTKMFSMPRVYNDWMIKQAIDPGLPLWSGVQKITAIGFFNFTLPQDFFYKTGIPFLLSIFFIGIVNIIICLIRALFNHQFPVWYVTIILWVIVYSIGIGAWVPLIRDRYFLPLAPLIAVITGYGFVVIMRSFWNILKRQVLSKEQKRILFFDSTGFAFSIIMTFFVWNNIMDSSVLPPYLCLNKNENIPSMYEKAWVKNASNPLRIIYTADAKLISHDLAGACLLYEKAINLFQSQPPLAMNMTMEAIAQYNLAQAYLKLSRFKDAEMMMEDHISTIRKIEYSLQTKDKKVISEFNRTIEERIKYLEHIRKTQKSKY